MSYTVLVMDRGRPLVKHRNLEQSVGLHLVDAYKALGWPPEKILMQQVSEENEQPENLAAA